MGLHLDTKCISIALSTSVALWNGHRIESTHMKVDKEKFDALPGAPSFAHFAKGGTA